MNIYELPKFNLPKFPKNKIFRLAVLIIFLSSSFGFLAGLLSGSFYYSQTELSHSESEGEKEVPDAVSVIEKECPPQATQEELIIKAVEDIWPSVVSIVVSKDVPVVEQYFYGPLEGFEEFFGDQFESQAPQSGQGETEKQEIGGGSGFIISEDGMVLTNKHVVSDEDADYTVFTNDGENYSAKVLARDPVQDIAILKIEQAGSQPFSTAKLGDSDSLQAGQTVIAIGSALGEFRNTVSVGVVSGLGRTITASSGGMVETLEDVIQTDAAINKGNSGGPLLNLKGEVIGINTATVVGAQSISFAIPANKAKRGIEQVKTLGKIIYPYLGVRYVPIDERVKEENNLPVDYGALIVAGGKGELAVIPGSAANLAGLSENDIILEFDGEKITTDNSLSKLIMKHEPRDEISLKIMRNGQERIISATLGERSE